MTFIPAIGILFAITPICVPELGFDNAKYVSVKVAKCIYCNLPLTRQNCRTTIAKDYNNRFYSTWMQG